MKLKSIIAGICMMLCAMIMPSIVASAEELEEQVMYLTDAEMEEIIEEEISNIINSRISSYALNWTVPANTRYATSYFRKEAGTSVGINAKLSKSCKVGILNSDGILRYVTGTTISHTFSITEGHNYKVFVQNDNSSSSTVSGYYYR